MSRKFYAVNRYTGERWKPRPECKEYLMLWDSGYPAVVQESGWDGVFITALDPKTWKLVMKPSVKLDDDY